MEPFRVIRIAHLPSASSHSWLVEDLWADRAVGFIGGPPKAGKTWLALDLAVSVASGLPCLGRFPVQRRGPVLLYAAEDSPDSIRQRVSSIAQVRGLPSIEHLAIGLIHEPQLRLDHDEDQQRLFNTLDSIRPRLLILDPLIRLHHADENSAGDVSSLLAFLRTLQRQLDLSIIVVHHVRKAASLQPGQALRGSGDLHAWSDSALYLLHQKDALLLHAEHRSLPSPTPFSVQLCSEPHTHLAVFGAPSGGPEEPTPRSLSKPILDALSKGPMTRTALRERLAVRNERLVQALAELEGIGRVRREGGMVALVPDSETTGTERRGVR